MDNGSRDFAHGPKAYGHTVATCRNEAEQRNMKYFALQHNGWCTTDNEFSTPAATYPKKPDAECGGKCSGETAKDDVLRCGAGWRNAVYSKGPTPGFLTQTTSDALTGVNFAARSAGGVAFGSGSLGGYCSNTAAGTGNDFPGSGIHCWKNINDGKLGNSHSWIPGGAPYFVGVRFGGSHLIEGFRVSRKGSGSCCNDRISGTLRMEYTTIANADHETAAAAWLSLGECTRKVYGFEYFKFSEPVHATAVRIVTDHSSDCIDELEVYG